MITTNQNQMYNGVLGDPFCDEEAWLKIFHQQTAADTGSTRAKKLFGLYSAQFLLQLPVTVLSWAVVYGLCLSRYWYPEWLQLMLPTAFAIFAGGMLSTLICGNCKTMGSLERRIYSAAKLVWLLAVVYSLTLR